MAFTEKVIVEKNGGKGKPVLMPVFFFLNNVILKRWVSSVVSQFEYPGKKTQYTALCVHVRVFVLIL